VPTFTSNSVSPRLWKRRCDALAGGQTRKGSKWLRLHLHEAARAASRTKGTYLSAQYKRIKDNRGASKARVAVEHSILVAAWHMLSRGEPYQDLGADLLHPPPGPRGSGDSAWSRRDGPCPSVVTTWSWPFQRGHPLTGGGSSAGPRVGTPR